MERYRVKLIYIYCIFCTLLLLVLTIQFDILQKGGEWLNRKVQIQESYENAYLDNKNYLGRLSMFKLNHREADIIFLGDSITANCNFDEFYFDENVLNRGISSDSSKGVFSRIDEVIQHSPRIVFIMIGVNDLGRECNINHVTNSVKATLDELVTNLPRVHVYLESVLPASSVSSERVIALNSEYCKLANNYDQVTYLDLYSLFLSEQGLQNEDLYLVDGVHLNGSGYEVMIRAQKEALYEGGREFKKN